MRMKLWKASWIMAVCILSFSLGAAAALGDYVVQTINGNWYYVTQGGWDCVSTTCSTLPVTSCIDGHCLQDPNYNNLATCWCPANQDTSTWYYCKKVQAGDCWKYWPLTSHSCFNCGCTFDQGNTTCSCGQNTCSQTHP